MLVTLRILLAAISIPAIIVTLCILLIVEEQAQLQNQWVLTANDITRAKEILNNSNFKQTGTKTLDLTEKDLNIALNYLLNGYIHSAAQIQLRDNRMDFLISIRLPSNHYGSYVNLKFTLAQQNRYPIIQSLSIGNLIIADELASLIIEKIIKYTQLKQYYVLFMRHIQHINIAYESFHITYRLTDESYHHARQLLTHGVENHVLLLYHRKLQETVDNHNKNWRLSLSDLFKALFKLAYERSSMDTAIAENRIVIFIINAYVNRQSINNYLPDSMASPVQPYPVYLYQRTDMAKHFVGSALLTSSGSGYLAHFLGLEKELQDSKQGSGFSFVDLAADRAGMYFGEIATSSPENARILQKAMSEIADYRAFMPEVRDLPENMQRSEFEAKYGSIYSRQYQQILQLVDQRISVCSVYQDI